MPIRSVSYGSPGFKTPASVVVSLELLHILVYIAGIICLFVVCVCLVCLVEKVNEPCQGWYELEGDCRTKQWNAPYLT